MKIGVITAMSSEFDHIVACLASPRTITSRLFSYCEGEIGGNTIRLMQSGIGKVNSALGAMELIADFAPDCLISTGVAGGVDRSVGVMDVVVSRRCCYHDVWCGEGNERGQVQGLPLYFESCEKLVECALGLSLEGSAIHGGLICSGDQFITSASELEVIKSIHAAALAVDMESSSIAQTCHLLKTPFVSFRIISDTPWVEEHQTQYENFWGEIASRSFRTIEKLLKSLPEKL